MNLILTKFKFKRKIVIVIISSKKIILNAISIKKYVIVYS